MKSPTRYLFGLLGHPVSHSVSPAMHKAALSYCGLEGDYKLIDVSEEALPELVRTLPDQGYCGLNVTIPHKLAIFEMASSCTQAAQKAGAVNCMKYGGMEETSQPAVHGFEGHNTDIGGLKQALVDAMTAHATIDGLLRNVCVLGAGGASRAALVVLEDLACRRISVAVRDERKAKIWLEDLEERRQKSAKVKTEIVSFDHLSNSSKMEKSNGLFDLIINCTPIGQRDTALPSWCHRLTETLKPSGFFLDMVYSRNSQDTPLVALFRAGGAQVSDGKMMLVHQARLAFQYWTGLEVPAEIFWQAAFSSDATETT